MFDIGILLGCVRRAPTANQGNCRWYAGAIEWPPRRDVARLGDIAWRDPCSRRLIESASCRARAADRVRAARGPARRVPRGRAPEAVARRVVTGGARLVGVNRRLQTEGRRHRFARPAAIAATRVGSPAIARAQAVATSR